jgi:hypothetical protein
MSTKSRLYLSVAAIALAGLLAGAPTQLRAQQSAAPGVNIGATDVGVVVTGPNGPEAGVWVIAETRDPSRSAGAVTPGTDWRGDGKT